MRIVYLATILLYSGIAFFIGYRQGDVAARMEMGLDYMERVSAVELEHEKRTAKVEVALEYYRRNIHPFCPKDPINEIAKETKVKK